MTEPRNERPREADLDEDERRLLDRLRNMPGEDQAEAVEDQPEVQRAAQDDTAVDPGLLEPGDQDEEAD